MKFAVGIFSVCVALSLLQTLPARADEAENSAPQPAAPIESLDSSIQRLVAAHDAAAAQPCAPAPALLPDGDDSCPAGAARQAMPPVEPPIAASAPVASPILYVYEFSASCCPSCRQLEPILKQIAQKYSGFIQYIPINVARHPELLQKLEIDLIPTVMVVDRNGKTLNCLVGLQQGVQLGAILEHYKTEATASLGGPY
jgi:thioredoxin 1